MSTETKSAEAALRNRIELIERAFIAYASDVIAGRSPSPINPPILGLCLKCGFPVYASERDGAHFHYSPQGYHSAPVVCPYAAVADSEVHS